SQVSCWFCWERQHCSPIRFNETSSTIPHTRDLTLCRPSPPARAILLGGTLSKASLAGAPKRVEDFRPSSCTGTPVMLFIAARWSHVCGRPASLRRSIYLHIPGAAPRTELPQ